MLFVLESKWNRDCRLNFTGSTGNHDTSVPVPFPRFFISLDAISIGHFAGEPDRNLYENFGQLVWHEHYAANRRDSLFPPLACTSLAKKQLQPPLVIPLLIPFWLGGETRFQSYCLESVRRVASPLSNELTFHETFVSGFNFSFRFVSFRDFRRDSEDDWPSAFRICLWRDPIPGNVIVSTTRMLLRKQSSVNNEIFIIICNYR